MYLASHIHLIRHTAVPQLRVCTSLTFLTPMPPTPATHLYLHLPHTCSQHVQLGTRAWCSRCYAVYTLAPQVWACYVLASESVAVIYSALYCVIVAQGGSCCPPHPTKHHYLYCLPRCCCNWHCLCCFSCCLSGYCISGVATTLLMFLATLSVAGAYSVCWDSVGSNVQLCLVCTATSRCC